MGNTADRVRNLVQSNLEVDGKPVGDLDDMNVSLTSLGVSSVDLVAFATLVNEEFSLNLTPEDCADIATLQRLVERIDANS